MRPKSVVCWPQNSVLALPVIIFWNNKREIGLLLRAPIPELSRKKKCYGHD